MTMGVAMFRAGFWTSVERRRTERYLRRAGHTWPRDPEDGPMSSMDCIALLLAAIDDGRTEADVLDDDADLERYARWTGRRGLLAEALPAGGWIRRSPDGSRHWHGSDVAFAGGA